MKSFALIFLATISFSVFAQNNVRARFLELNLRKVCNSEIQFFNNGSVKCIKPKADAVINGYSGEYLKSFIPTGALTPAKLKLVGKSQAPDQVRTFEVLNAKDKLVGYRTEFDYFPTLGVVFMMMYTANGEVVFLDVR